VLRYICQISDFRPDFESLSLTTRRKKLEYSKLDRDLIGIKHRERFNDGEYKVILSRVVLLINNATSPTVIWKKPR
jgi:hypothetical protein